MWQWKGATTMSLQADFDQAAEDVRKLKARPDDEELKELYGLYKQSVIGDVNIGIYCLLKNSEMLCLSSVYISVE